MERPRQSIFGEIQIHVGNSPGPIDSPVHKKEIRGKLQRICNQVEECGINGPTTLHQSKRKFHVRGYSASPYYDMLVVNAFVEFGHLMYSVGKIEDGIKREKIVDTRASMKEKKRIVPDKHVQAMFRERRSKRKSHMARDEPVVDFPHSSSYAKVPLASFSSP